MNPLRMFRIYRAANKLAGLFEEAHVSKSLFKSKIFWTQVLTAAAELSGVLPLPVGTATAIGAIATTLLRLLGTSQPTHLVSPAQ